MKILYFLVPIAGWVGLYFLGGYSEQFIKAQPDAEGLWWLLTNMLSFIGVAISFAWAYNKQK